jgi:hypothetical protein
MARRVLQPAVPRVCEQKERIGRCLPTDAAICTLGTGSSSLPDRLELKPSDKDYTESVGWIDGAEFTLQAPIIKVTLADFIDEEEMRALREVFEFWVVATGKTATW